MEREAVTSLEPGANPELANHTPGAARLFGLRLGQRDTRPEDRLHSDAASSELGPKLSEHCDRPLSDQSAVRHKPPKLLSA